MDGLVWSTLSFYTRERRCVSWRIRKIIDSEFFLKYKESNIGENNHLVHITLVLNTIETQKSWYDFMDSKIH